MSERQNFNLISYNFTKEIESPSQKVFYILYIYNSKYLQFKISTIWNICIIKYLQFQIHIQYYISTISNTYNIKYLQFQMRIYNLKYLQMIIFKAAVILYFNKWYFWTAAVILYFNKW